MHKNRNLGSKESDCPFGVPAEIFTAEDVVENARPARRDGLTSPIVLKSAYCATGWNINRPSTLLALINLTLPSCWVETRSPLGAPVFPFQDQADAAEDGP
jgi:hypothetical protein